MKSIKWYTDVRWFLLLFMFTDHLASFWGVSIFSLYPFRMKILCIGCLLCSQMILFEFREFFPSVNSILGFCLLFSVPKGVLTHLYSYVTPLPFVCLLEHPLYLSWGTYSRQSQPLPFITLALAKKKKKCTLFISVPFMMMSIVCQPF